MAEREDVEQVCTGLAESAGWLTRKLDVGPGGKGWLDQLFLGPNNCHFIVEFKTDVGTGTVSIKQSIKIRRLTKMGHDVYVVGSVDRFKEILRHHQNVAKHSGQKYEDEDDF